MLKEPLFRIYFYLSNLSRTKIMRSFVVDHDDVNIHIWEISSKHRVKYVRAAKLYTRCYTCLFMRRIYWIFFYISNILCVFLLFYD